MTTDTLFVVGPGGIGKSPLDRCLKADVSRIDPYRLRHAGPRDSKDVFYGHPHLRDELYLIYQRLGVGHTFLSDDIHWFPDACTLFLKVRGEWQFLFLQERQAGIAKAEIFAPAIPVILENPQIRRFFGRVSMLVLNPANALATLDDLAPIKEMTRTNCIRRGDSADSIERRVASIDEEVEAWRRMIALGAIECCNWEFAEYVYAEKGERQTLVQARRVLLDRCPSLDTFF